MIQGRLIVSLALIVIGVVASIATIQSGVFAGSAILVDDFDDNSLASFWTASNTGTGNSVAEVNQRAEFHFDANSMDNPESSVFLSGIEHECMLVGDFTLIADFELLAWPSLNGVRMGIQTPPWTVERLSDFAGDNYATDFGGAVTLTPTNDTSGALRLMRQGSTVTGSYDDGGSWVDIETTAGNTDPVSLRLQSWSHDDLFADQVVDVAFDNLTFVGTLSCPETPTPAPTETPEPTESPPPTQTPTPTPVSGQEVVWGDSDCDGDNDAVDALIGLRFLVGFNVNQNDSCPAFAAFIEYGLLLGISGAPAGGGIDDIGLFVERTWGDHDCDDDVDAVDSLQELRHVAGLPVNQADDCPEIGSPGLVKN